MWNCYQFNLCGSRVYVELEFCMEMEITLEVELCVALEFCVEGDFVWKPRNISCIYLPTRYNT